LFSPSHQNALTSASKLGPQHDKKISADLFKQNAAKFSLFLLFCSFISGNFFVFFMLMQLGRFLGPLSLQWQSARRQKERRSGPFQHTYINPLYKYMHICPLGQANLQCCNSKIINCCNSTLMWAIKFRKFEFVCC